MRPLTEVKEIPSIEFSFFNPAEGAYTTLNSRAIPINVKPAEEMPSKASQMPQAIPKPAVPAKNYLPAPIEIQSNYNQ